MTAVQQSTRESGDGGLGSSEVERAVAALDDVLRAHYAQALTPTEFVRRAEQLQREGYVKISELLPRDLMEKLSVEVKSIVEAAARRIDIAVPETGNSPRKMRTVNFADITRLGRIAPALYYAREMRDFLSSLAGHRIEDCAYENERLTVTKQDTKGDTHGWHWGDYQYALIFIIEAPPIEVGGMLQCVPHVRWNKQNPRLHETLVENPIRTYHHETGDIYFFRTDTTLHRTYPLEQDCTRIILNFTFAGPDDLMREKTHETMTAIYDW